MRNYPLDNLLREPTKAYAGITYLACAVLILAKPHVFLLTEPMSFYAAIVLTIPGVYRCIQALRIKRYHRHLLAMPRYALSTKQIPLSKKQLFIGRGFRWQAHHTQRLHQIKQIKNEGFMKQRRSLFKPFKSISSVGGSHFLHGLGGKDKPVYIPQDVRVGHTFVVGTTRVGKTRLASLLINQDIRNGDAVIVVDPKGDLELVREEDSNLFVMR